MTHDLLPMTFLNPSVLALVLGGTLGATITSSSLRHVLSIPGALRRAVSGSAPDPVSTVRMLVEFARVARREGFLALEERIDKVSDSFLIEGIRMVVDGTPPDVLREVLDARMVSTHERNRVGEAVFSLMARLSPGIGVVGTIICLIQGAQVVDSTAGIGPAVGAAFVPALYGVAAAYLFFLPVSVRLKARAEEEIAVRDLIVEGILSVQAGDNPRVIETKLKAMLPSADCRTVKRGSVLN